MARETELLESGLSPQEMERHFDREEQARRSTAIHLRAGCGGDLRRLPRVARLAGIPLAVARHLIFEYTQS